MKEYRKLSGFLIDVDGVLLRNKTLLPGSKEFIDYLNCNLVKYLIITNNSTYTPLSLSRFFKIRGISIKQENIITSSMATATYLTNNFGPKGRAYVIGSLVLKRILSRSGWVITDTGKVDVVVVGLDRKFNYRKLSIAQNMIFQGAKLIGTNHDSSFPTDNGKVEPGGGAILKAVEYSSGVEAVIMGKPDGLLVDLALAKLGQLPEKTAFIGDRIDTDVATAKKHGLVSILVLSGITTFKVNEKKYMPDLTVRDLVELLSWLNECQDIKKT